jgi:hypothetical protein
VGGGGGGVGGGGGLEGEGVRGKSIEPRAAPPPRLTILGLTSTVHRTCTKAQVFGSRLLISLRLGLNKTQKTWVLGLIKSWFTVGLNCVGPNVQLQYVTCGFFVKVA